MKVVVRSFQGPRWIAPLLILAVLALVPFALMLALGLAVLGLGVMALRTMLPGPGPEEGPMPLRVDPKAGKLDSQNAIEADYEVKDAD